MIMNPGFFRGFGLALIFGISSVATEVTVDDSDGALGAANAPVIATLKLTAGERRAAEQGRLQVSEVGKTATLAVPAQIFQGESPARTRICWLMPQGGKGKRRFKLETTRHGLQPQMFVARDALGQFDISELGKPVLRYNYATIEPGDIISKVATNSRIYARARSDYIHPLFGLDSETLTKDWSIDHPHHRGIYWAWPEVDWRTNRGDLHALQHVFARPTGKCTVTSGSVFAQIIAENVWKWGDTNAVVRERSVLRAYRATGDDRIVDLEFEFTAIDEPVLLARRGTDKYGGLNLRFAKVDGQDIVTNTSPVNVTPRAAWAEISGRFGGAANPSGIVVLQHRSNPDYPGDWVAFPNLDWLQPTFPASGTRYELKSGQPLRLHFRLWLHRGGKAGEERCAAQWRAFQLPATPQFLPMQTSPKR